MTSRLDSLHVQLGTLLENAQWLLADSAPSSTSGYGYHGAANMGAAGGAYGGYGSSRHQPLHAHQPAVYSFLAMQVSSHLMWRKWCRGLFPTSIYLILPQNEQCVQKKFHVRRT